MTRPGDGPDDAPRATLPGIEVLDRIQYLLLAILILMVFWSIWAAKVVIFPLVLGVLFTLTLSPLVRWLTRSGLPTSIAAVAVIVTIGGGSATGLYLMSGPASSLVESVPEMRAAAESKLVHLRHRMAQMQEAEEQVQELASGGDGEEKERILIDGPNIVETALSSLAGVGTTLVIALILAMFLLASGDMFQQKLVRSFPRFQDKKRALRISRDVERQISRYLGAITVINAGLGVSVAAALWLLGMPYPYVWGVAAFALNFMPYLGAMIGVAAITATSLITFDTTGQMIVPPLVYLLLTSLEGQVVTPVLVGRHLSLNAAAVFVAVIFWAWLWGVAGALMAVPFLVMVKVVCDHVPALTAAGMFLSGPEPDRTGRRGGQAPPLGSG
ncbi:AI-2E family transporter [Pseudooceanicola sp.]|uniref:AI-2E family transporter n=1 Tax=Pseudooceanicola sp. TaxID=1914328 RepID=UPI0035C78A88